MPIGEGFWIAPDGQLFQVYDHFSFVKEDPVRFGFTEEFIKSRPDEKRLKEGARARVLTEAVRRGWIRVRRVPRGVSMIFEVWRITDETLFRIAEAIREKGIASRGENVRVQSVRDSAYETLNVGDMLKGAYFRANPRSFCRVEMKLGTDLTPSDVEFLRGEVEGFRANGQLAYLRRKGRGQWVLKVANWNWQTQHTPATKDKFTAEMGEYIASLEDELDIDVEETVH